MYQGTYQHSSQDLETFVSIIVNYENLGHPTFRGGPQYIQNTDIKNIYFLRNSIFSLCNVIGTMIKKKMFNHLLEIVI